MLPNQPKRFPKIISAFVFATLLLPAASRLFAQQSPTVVAELTSKSNTKSAKVGDILTAKTLGAVVLKDGTKLPRGTKLTGTVTFVQTKSGESNDSFLAIKFDQVQIKNAAPVAIQSFLLAIAPAPTEAGELPLKPTGGGGSLSTVGGYGHQDPDYPTSLPTGSTVSGVALSTQPDKTGSSVLKGTGKDIKLDSGMRIYLQFQ